VEPVFPEVLPLGLPALVPNPELPLVVPDVVPEVVPDVDPKLLLPL
jgi:hypothetical protein